MTTNTLANAALRVSALACLMGPTAALAQGSVPGDATDVPKNEIQAVFESLNGGVDKQVRVVDIGSDTNVAVGILHRDTTKSEHGPTRGIVHQEVTEIYYILSGSGTLVTGGTVETGRQWPADSGAVRELVGPSISAQSTNGRSRLVSEGDIVVIPAGVFHGFSEIEDDVSYLSLRVDPEQTLPAEYVNPVLEP